MKRSAFLASSLVAALASGAFAQPAPFDMTGEGRPAPPAVPSETPSGREPAPQPAAPPPQAVPAPEAAPSVAPATAGPADQPRYLVPAERVTLSGEIASSSWNVFLTAGEAAAARTLRMGYQSSILVAPEASRLRFIVNGYTLIETPVQSPGAVGEIAVEIPPDILRAGSNMVRLEASMRHRTDCTVQSTYDLWAEIDGSRTFVTFDPTLDRAPSELGDVRAVGFDEAGLTNFTVVLPAGRVTEAAPHMIRLAQGLGVLADTPNPAFTMVSEAPAGATAPGHMPVLLGPAELLSPIVGALPPEAADAPFADFVPYENGQALLLSGPNWGAVGAAVERLVAPSDRPASVRRTSLSAGGLQAHEIPLTFDAADILLRDLGVRTEEFSGRRFRSEFQVAVPADFFAEAYGEATLLVDMAYTGAVLPGSRFDVYVNGNIATTLPIGSTSGQVLRQFPVPVTMRHLVPGANTIAIEAILDTAADTACLPGTAQNTDTRFVLFDTSQLQIPSFARISSRPSLSALSGVGYPYSRLSDPIPFVLGEATLETLSAGATLAGKIAQMAGRPVPFDTTLPASAAVGLDAVFVGPASRIPAGILSAIGVSEDLRTNWSNNLVAPPEGEAQTEVTIESWRQQVGGGWNHPFERFDEWLEANLDLSLDALRLVGPTEEPFLPPSESDLMVAQGVDPNLSHSWTIVSARSSAELASGTAELARRANWAQLAGRLTYHDAEAGAYVALPASNAHLVPSVEPSFGNLRLVAANWLSERPLVYALVLAFASVVLGAATATLTSNSGRHR